jgi:hypothetical protein
MKEDCLDIGTVQAFIDGELDHGRAGQVSAHMARCEACSLMLADAEDESAVVLPTLEREFNTVVPTQRLWSRINDSIANERKNRPFWQKAWAILHTGLLTPSMAAAASLLIVASVAALVMIYRGPTGVYVANVSSPKTVTAIPMAAHAIPSGTSTREDDSRRMTVTDSSSERANYRPVVRRQPLAPTRKVLPAAPDVYMPGEESYVRTIASLSRSVEGEKDNVMRPAERISFERNMAVVDDAITKMRTEVRRDPSNGSARQVLYSSYQNKIDLLNSVSQKEELVASLK